jgi:hypothetical protein
LQNNYLSLKKAQSRSYEFPRFLRRKDFLDLINDTTRFMDTTTTNAVVQRLRRFSLTDYAQMLTSAPQRAAEAQVDALLAELDKAQESVRTSITDNLEKAQALFTSALPLVVRNIVKKSGALTVEMLENDVAMKTVAHTAYTLMPSVFRLLINEELFATFLLQSRTALVHYVEQLEQTKD